MDYVRDAVLATIIYYNAFDYPLTWTEVFRLLINPTRIARNVEAIDEIRPTVIISALEQLVTSGHIGQKHGMYFLRGREDLQGSRIRRNKIADRKWRIATKRGYWLASAPFVQAFFASGSMALYNTDTKSDFDIFVISKTGRLYTSRIFLSLIAFLLSSLRRKGDHIAPNKFCFNHYITDGSLEIMHRSVFAGQIYANLKPVFVSEKTFYDFHDANIWINKYLYNFEPQFEYQNIKVRPRLNGLKNSIENILSGNVGDWLENILKKYQQNRIKANPMTYEHGGRVTFSDNELEFHPRSFESTVIAKYNENTKKFGLLLPAEEKDSGLLQ